MKHLSIILLTITCSFATAGTIFGTFKHNRCYSCMSAGYEPFYYGALDRHFNEPRNFTNNCDEPMNPEGVDVVACRTICLTVQQDLVIMGQKTGRRLTIRGCALTISKKGIYNHTLSLFDRFDVCREMNAADLFRHEARSDSQRVKVCSCLGDRCNGAMTASASGRALALLILILSLLARSQ